MTDIVNRLIKKIKGESLVIDNRISKYYIFKLVIKRVLMVIRGFCYLSIKKNGLVFIGRDVTIIEGSKISAAGNLTINRRAYIDALSAEGIKLGKNVSIGRETAIECTGNLRQIGLGIIVGNNVGLGTNSFYGCAGGIVIGNDTIIGNFVSFHSENHNAADLDIPIRLQGVNHKGIKIGNNCWLGAKVTVLDGVQLGNGCIVAAGAVLKAGVYPDNCIYGGVPAKLLKHR